MSTRKTIILCISTFTLGLVLGLLLLKYIFPNLTSINQSLQEEKVYEVEHNVCPVEEKTEECNIYVDISGALNNPGVYCLNNGSLVVDAVKKAGGFNTNVALEYVARSINLAKPLTNGQKLYFPSTSELLCELKDFTLKEEEVIPTESQNENTTETNTTENTTKNDCININTATITQLDSLDGVGTSTAQKIIDNRPYSKISDLLNVSGIGETTYNKFKDNICI